MHVGSRPIRRRRRDRSPGALARWVVGLLLAGAAGCVNVRSDRGVETRWREVDAGAFQPGVTTREQVLELLGPPSQILSLEDETAFYYMLERTRGKGMILLVYNDRRERTVYERAVFFFDARDVLTEYATSAPSDTD